MDKSERENRRGFIIFCTVVGTWLTECAIVIADDLLSLRKGRRRITPLCSVPTMDYQHGARTPSVLVRSLPAIAQLSTEYVNLALDVMGEQSRDTALLPSSPADKNSTNIEQILARADTAFERRLNSQAAMSRATQPKAKLMQLATHDVTIAHCRISDVTMLIEPSGVWHLSLRGDQNFSRVDQRDNRNSELQIKRNAFNVTMRLLRSNRSGGENLTPNVGRESSFDQAGKLTYAEIKLPEFWVQREAPQLITRTGNHPMIACHYDDIDQVEYEFFIRLDALTSGGEGVVAE